MYTKCIIKNDGTTIGIAENLDLVISMYNLIEYSSNYPGTTGSLLFYSKDEATNFNDDIANTNAFKSFNYKTKLLGKTVVQPNPNQVNGNLENATIVVPFENQTNFWRSRKMPFINCKVELKLKVVLHSRKSM